MPSRFCTCLPAPDSLPPGRIHPLGRPESSTYDPTGNLASSTDRKGQVTNRTYDALDRLAQVTYADGSTITYGWDAGNALRQITDSQSGTITRTYDLLDRLTEETTPQGSISYTDDAAGRRTSMTVAGQPAVTYGYDNANRLLTITQGSNVVTVTYDAAGRRTSVTRPNGVVTEYTYDAASRVTGGNLLSDGTSGYTWDARNRLTGITGPSTATFQYDTTGRRTRKTINGLMTDFVHDGINPVTESGPSGTGFLLTGLGVDDFLLRSDPVSTSMFLTDALGSLVATTDSAGGVQSELTYEPFGNTEMSAPAPAYRFTGREDDEPLYLYYYRARYYHPDLQRFIVEDPIGFGGGDWNLYAYVGNNPIRFNDPSGTEKCSDAVSMFGSNFWDNLVMTNAALFSTPAQLIKFGAGVAVGTGKIFADAMGTVNPWAAVTATARGVRGFGATAVRTGSISAAAAALGAAGVANLTIDATIISGAVTAGVGAIATSAALEGGIVFGSAYSALIDVAEACRIVPDAPILF